MPMLNPRPQSTKTQVRINLDDRILARMNDYCAWAELKKIDEFIEQAAEIVFKKDREWVKHQAKHR